MIRNRNIIDGLKLVGSESEQNILYLFAEYFQIDFAKEVGFKNSEYVFYFMKPMGNIVESFNFKNEILLLYSKYLQFDRRIFDFVDKLMVDYRNRLDQVCLFLVSTDDCIEKHIRDYNSENEDSRVVIPFSYNELSIERLPEYQLANKLRKFFYSRDLFAKQSPIRTDAYFFGRSTIVQTLYDRYIQGEHSGLFGLRRIGKTSVLYALQRTVRLRGGISQYIDCQNTSSHKKRWNEFLEHIIILISRENSITLKSCGDPKRYAESCAADSFYSDLLEIQSIIDMGKIDRTRILIIFDEIEHITATTSSSEHWEKGRDYLYFWQSIRATYQADPSLFSYIIAGVNPYCIERSTILDYPNPIMNSLQPIYLELFNIQTIREMITNIGNYMGLRFEEEIYGKLKEDYGGHPSLVRNVCSTINNNCTSIRPYTVTRYRYIELKPKLDDGISALIEDIMHSLKKWYSDEYILLETLVVDGSEAFMEEITHSSEAVQHLVGYGVISEPTSSQKEYHIAINAIAEYVKKDHIVTAIPSKIEKVWAEVSQRRNRIEAELRTLVRNVITAQYGKANKRLEKFVEILDASKKSRALGKDLTYVLENVYMFDDYRLLILNNWSLFDKYFDDKSMYAIYFSFINKYRIDAHAKTIADDNMATLRIALQWFEDKLFGD